MAWGGVGVTLGPQKAGSRESGNHPAWACWREGDNLRADIIWYSYMASVRPLVQSCVPVIHVTNQALVFKVVTK